MRANVFGSVAGQKRALGMWDFHDQAADAQQAQPASDFGLLAAAFGIVGGWGEQEVALVGNSRFQSVLSVKQTKRRSIDL